MPNVFLLRRIDDEIALAEEFPDELRKRLDHHDELPADVRATLEKCVAETCDDNIAKLKAFRKKVEVA